MARIRRAVENLRLSRLQPVINGTGVVIHTNFGRSPLPAAALDAIRDIAGVYSNLEFDLATGQRGGRAEYVNESLAAACEAESAAVVNNCAAALVLILRHFVTPQKPEVVLSRGELVQIGGGFRVPEILESAGATLREVGTTNRTHPDDYEQAINDKTALLLKVHTSNYRIVGFSSDVDLPALASIARRRSVPVMEDLGSGALVDLSRYGLPKEPVVAERVAMGADVVTFSGDKMLGGPQAGLLVGRRAIITEISRNPLHRALRCGKLTIAALEATLRIYRESPNLAADIPALRSFTRPLADLEADGRQVLPALVTALGDEFTAELDDSTSQIGSGALPTDEIPTKVIAIRHGRFGADWIAERFRAATPPIIGRVKDDAFLLDLRTVANPEDVVPHWAV
jgi:L-seryl-tRNA(Ser) seleniumtransferase